MQHTYRCGDCGAEFTGSRKRCEYCGTVGAATDRSECRECGQWLTDSPHQECPVCGSSNVDKVALRHRD
ncbi:hypothetical protein HWV07_01505 [Natronomonas salina]|uniref:hypothetical protein n=1 Tax=Natronomonas salina TaxID=1710540 RepID=UPI0015B50FDF|nr:hypothetical protein [Natronomonas salina]QLD87780.1 hypothetical protein HWV07_01505 [Natronomonas salina]